ncbi:MAG: MFS transporter [Chloroherpetonaceae bacterium]|nr:MFS transporter [Chloroherpetonaceae bacterium]
MTQTNEDSSVIRRVITASSVGTLIEWYDFYIFGSLAAIISTQFFPKTNPTAALLSTLATFAAGFVVRPFGALLFGRLGDIVGRKYTFLLTLVLMGGSTFAIGIVPSYESIGFTAPAIVFVLRLLQGLALGGEYGGAATYVAEHSPLAKRGYYTSYIQTTATLGLFISLGVILLVRLNLTAADFNSWGWRIPFVLSVFLVAISIYIRLKMAESPLFAKLKAEGKTSSNPLAESFKKKANLKLVLLALLGATMGQGVVWYTGQFYALSFIQNTCSIEFVQANNVVAIALLVGTPFFIVFGWLSDKVGRKWIMMAGMIIAVLAYRPIYTAMFELANLKAKTEVEDKRMTSIKPALVGADSVITTEVLKTYTDGTTYKEVKKETFPADSAQRASAVAEKKLPPPEVKKETSLGGGNFWMMMFLILVQVIFVTMVYGPIAAFLVELFPTRIRYTSMSLPYHIGNGVFGGLVPLISTRLVEASRPGPGLPPADPLAGLFYPMLIAAVCFVIGVLYLPNKSHENEIE